MKKFNIRNLNKKTSILSVLLLIAVIGVGATIALAVAQTSPVVNTFKAGKIDTSIGETVSGFDKSVKVTNSENAQSDAFVRVRLNCPQGITLVLPGIDDGTWVDGKDGFYYYLYSLAPKATTTELLGELKVADGYTESFDVTVYQESCIATEISHYGDGTPIEISTIQDAFKNATGTVHTTE